MFGLFGKKGREARKSLENLANADLMQAIVYGCIYVAAADGEIEAEEMKRIEGMLANDKKLANFGNELQQILDKAKADFESGGSRIIRMNAERELDDLVNDPEGAETVINFMLTVSEADGEIDAKEMVALERAAKKMGLKLDNYL